MMTVSTVASSHSSAGPALGSTIGERSQFPGAPLERSPRGAIHDLALTASNVTSLAGDPVDFTSAVPGGAVSYGWTWGDGSQQSSASGSAVHNYSNPGIYYVWANATDASGGLHDNLYSLLHLPVLSSYANDSLGNLAQVSGSIVANTTSTSNASSVIAPGGVVVVSNWLVRPPTSPFTSLGTPSYALSPSASPYATVSQSILNLSGLSGVTVSFSSSTPTGSYDLNFSVPTIDSGESPTLVAWSNFTFTIFVGAGASSLLAPIPTSTDPGTLRVFTEDSVGAVSLDPQIEYNPGPESLNYEVYQTLIAPNGSQAGPNPQDFVPDLAMCVPGSSECTTLYGSTLVANDSYTFVVDPNAQFYNASTGAHWAVHPNDVAFSFARACLYAAPGWTFTTGFAMCQALLPGPNSPVNPANGTWDPGAGYAAIHFPVNDTPANLLSAIRVNDSEYCTPTMMNGVSGAGCVTLNTSLSGRAWPEFLEFLAEGSDGQSIISCNWWAQNFPWQLQSWTMGGACLPAPPGTAPNPNPTPGETAWDNVIEATPSYGSVAGDLDPLQTHALGSGPYALTSFDNLTGFSLSYNPYWGGTSCQGGLRDGCLPPATPPSGSPAYIPTVKVTYETTPGPGLAALARGDADLVDGGGSSNTSLLLDLLNAGQLGIVSIPTITTWWDPMFMEYSPSQTDSLIGWTPTLPPDALQDLNFRQFLVSTYPHASDETQYCEPQGIQYCFQYGGTIPALMQPYYPSNVSWDFDNPVSDPSVPGSAGWWWHQVETDSVLGPVCTLSTPCTIPIVNPYAGLKELLVPWAEQINVTSGGAVIAIVVNTPWATTLLACFFGSPGSSPCPVSQIGWLPDFFDPSDYTDSQLLPNSQGGEFPGTAVYPGLSGYTSSCPGTFTDPQVDQACQGTALQAMERLIQEADECASPACSASQRALLYDMAEQIENQLGLEVSTDQVEAIGGVAPWIDPSTLSYNPQANGFGTIDGQFYYTIGYLGSIPPGYHMRLSHISTPSGSGSGLTLETGTPFLMLVSVTGGTGSYQFTWNNLPGGCASVDTAGMWCTPTAPGNYSVTVLVRDSADDVALTSPVTIVVVPRPSITSFAIDPPALTLGGTSQLQVVARGGIGGLTVAYVGLPAGCQSQNLTTLPCTPTQTGSFSITASVADRLGLQAFSIAVLTVSSSVMVSFSRATVSPTSASLAAGGSQVFDAVAVGSDGTPLWQGVVFQWSLVPAALGTLNASVGPTVTFTASSSSAQGVLELNASYGGRSGQVAVPITVTGPSPPPPTPTNNVPAGYYTLLQMAPLLGLVFVAGLLAGMVVRLLPKGGSGDDPGPRSGERAPPRRKGEVADEKETAAAEEEAKEGSPHPPEPPAAGSEESSSADQAEREPRSLPSEREAVEGEQAPETVSS